MPRKDAKTAVEGSKELRQKLSIISENVGNSKRALARELGISYYQASKIINAKKENKPLSQWFGEKGDIKAYGRVVKLERAVGESRFQEVEQRRGGKPETAYVMTPPKDAPIANPFKHKKFKNGYRESYHPDSSKNVNIPSGAYVQIYAKGKGKSKGKKINKLFSTAKSDLNSAWRSYNRYRNQTGFIADNVEIVVTVPGS